MVLKKKINPKYLPKSLSKSDKEKQLKSLEKQTSRPKLDSFQSKRSPWVKNFEKKYNTKITDFKYIDKHLLPQKGIDKVLNKGRGAYYTSGSRPNQTTESWALARLASVLLKGPAYDIDKKIAQKHGRRKWLS